MSKRISIHGCSWTQGEWHQDGGYQLHGGLAQYLREAGHAVRNWGRAGDSNHRQIAQMRDIWANGPRPDFSVIVLTDICRDLHDIPAREGETLEAYCQRAMERYRGEILLCDRVLVVGGLQIVPEEWFGVATVNWFDLLTLEEPWRQWWPDHFINYATQRELAERGLWPQWWPQDTQSLQNKNHDTAWRVLVRNRQWFWPDGFHPNRHGHGRLARWVQERLY